MFSEIDIKINVIKNVTNSAKKLKHHFNIDNYYLNLDKHQLTNYLSFLEVYGEFVLKSKI